MQITAVQQYLHLISAGIKYIKSIFKVSGSSIVRFEWYFAFVVRLTRITRRSCRLQTLFNKLKTDSTSLCFQLFALSQRDKSEIKIKFYLSKLV